MTDDYDFDDDEMEEDLASENDRDDTEPSEVTSLADDPVRMYLKEIGQVPLLNTNREIWLSTQIAAENLVQTLTDQLSHLEGDVADAGGLPSPVEIVLLAY